MFACAGNSISSSVLAGQRLGIKQADVRERIAQLGLEADLNSPEEFAVVIKSDTAKWAKVIRAANIKPE